MIQSVEEDYKDDINLQTLYEDLPLGNIEDLELRQQYIANNAIVEENAVAEENAESWQTEVIDMVSTMVKSRKPQFIKFESSLTTSQRKFLHELASTT